VTALGASARADASCSVPPITCVGPPKVLALPVRASAPLPVLLNTALPLSGPANVTVCACVSSVPPPVPTPGPITTERAACSVKAASARKLPPASVSAPLLAPSAALPLIANVPALTPVPPL